MDDKKYSAEIAILLKRQMGKRLSKEESDRLEIMMRTDEYFKRISSKIISEDYISQIERYKNQNIEERISAGVHRKIKAASSSGHKKVALLLSSAAAVIAIIITTALNYLGNNNHNSSDYMHEIATLMEQQNNSDVVILVNERGKKEKLEGTTYNISQQSILSVTSEATLSKIIVPASKEFNIVLSDGTKVWLNSSSSLTFPEKFQTGERVVELDGEGYFDVAHDSNSPFIVKNSVMNTRVLGTKFMISAYSNNTTRSVALVEGQVVVSSNDANYKQNLTPGRGVKYSVASATFQTEDINIAAIEAKRQGLFVFENSTLSDICNDLTRHYQVTFDLSDEILKNKIFYIITKKYDSIETILELLHVAGELNYKIEDDRVILF